MPWLKEASIRLGDRKKYKLSGEDYADESKWEGRGQEMKYKYRSSGDNKRASPRTVIFNFPIEKYYELTYWSEQMLRYGKRELRSV